MVDVWHCTAIRIMSKNCPCPVESVKVFNNRFFFSLFNELVTHRYNFFPKRMFSRAICSCFIVLLLSLTVFISICFCLYSSIFYLVIYLDLLIFNYFFLLSKHIFRFCSLDYSFTISLSLFFSLSFLLNFFAYWVYDHLDLVMRRWIS